MILKRASAAVNRYCVRLRRTQWAAFCTSLNACAGIMRVLKDIHALAGIRKQRELFRFLALISQKTVSETAELFSSHFVSGPAANAPSTTNISMTALSADAPLPSPVVLATCQSKIASFDAPGHCLSKEKSALDTAFTLSELDYAHEAAQKCSGSGQLEQPCTAEFAKSLQTLPLCPD